MAGQQGAIWAIDGAWAAWLMVWVVLSRRVKPVFRGEGLPRRVAHVVPLMVAALLLFFSIGRGQTWLERPLLARAAWMLPAGAVLVWAGLGFAIWARLVLAGNWSGTVTIKQDHALIRRGPYGWVRHPIYTGLLVAMLGNAVAIDAARGLLAWAIITAAFLRKLRAEEAFMAEAFGAAYADYRRQVPALIPSLRFSVASPAITAGLPVCPAFR